MKQKIDNNFIENGVLYMECKKCGFYVEASEDATAITCSTCVQRICLTSRPELVPELDPNRKVSKPGRPSGWHFMSVFVDTDGTVFHKGKEKPKLKGTLKPTKVKKKKKLKKTIIKEIVYLS